jgi:hypothetical protein
MRSVGFTFDVIAGWSAKRGMPATHERPSGIVFMGGRDKPGHDVALFNLL